MRIRILTATYVLLCFVSAGCAEKGFKFNEQADVSHSHVAVVTIEDADGTYYSHFVSLKVRSDDKVWYAIPFFDMARIALPIHVEVRHVAGCVGSCEERLTEYAKVRGELRYHDCGDGFYCFDSFKEIPEVKP